MLVAGFVGEALDAIGEREIKPGLVAGWVAPKGEIVGVAEVVEEVGHLRELVGLRVPAFEDEDAALRVVGEVVHAGGEDAAVRGLGEKADPSEAAGGDVDVEIRGKAQGDRLVWSG